MGNRSIEKILLATGIVFSVSSFAHCDLPFFMRAHAKTNHQSSTALQSAFNTNITNEWSDLGWPTDSQDSQLFSTVFDNSGNLFAVLLMRASTSSGFAPSSIVEYTNNTWTTISANYLPTTGDGEPLTVFVSNNKVYALFVKTLGNAPFYAPYQLSIYQYSGKGTSWTKILNSSITTASDMVMTGNGPIVANGVLYAIEEKPLLSTTPTAYIQTYNIANKAWGSNITVPLQNDEEIENISSDSANNLYVEYKRHFSSCDRDGIEVYDSVRGTWNIDILSANALFAGDHPYLDCPTYFVGQQDAFYSLLADRITNALSIYQNLSGVWEKNNPIALSDHANPYAMYVDSSTGNLYVLMQDYDINIKGWRYHIERYANTASGVWSNLGSGNATAALSEGGSINNASMLVNNSYLYAQGTEASNGALTLLRTLA